MNCDKFIIFLDKFFSSQLFGVIIGAILTAGFNWFIEWRKSKKEQKLHIREKREETYIAILNILYLLSNESLNFNNKDISEERKLQIDKYCPLINIYASKKVFGKYNLVVKKIDAYYMGLKSDMKYIEDLPDNMIELQQIIRKELGIKD